MAERARGPRCRDKKGFVGGSAAHKTPKKASPSPARGVRSGKGAFLANAESNLTDYSV